MGSNKFRAKTIKWVLSYSSDENRLDIEGIPAMRSFSESGNNRNRKRKTGLENFENCELHGKCDFVIDTIKKAHIMIKLKTKWSSSRPGKGNKYIIWQYPLGLYGSSGGSGSCLVIIFVFSDSHNPHIQIFFLTWLASTSSKLIEMKSQYKCILKIIIQKKRKIKRNTPFFESRFFCSILNILF